MGAMVLLAVVWLGTLGFHLLGGYGWLEAFWMVVITISTVGFGERSQAPAAVQLLSIGVILVGISSAAYTFSGLIQFVLAGELERMQGVKRMSRQIEKLRDHVVICGMGRSGRSLALELRHFKREFVVIDKDEVKLEEARSLDFPAIFGDATEEAILIRAGVDRAQALVSALPSDADNVFITLTARELNRNLLILASAEHEKTAKKLHQAGAQKVVMPARVSAMQMSRMILHPSTADLMELVAESSYLDLELDDLNIKHFPALVGLTVQGTEAHRKHELLVLAVRKADGTMIFNPAADYEFVADDIAMVLGHRSRIDDFKAMYRKSAGQSVSG